MTAMQDLNEAQRSAAEHGAGPLLVIAGAGTGKTRTLAARVGHLIASGVAPERILLLTFSRAAAREMLARLVPGGNGPPGIPPTGLGAGGGGPAPGAPRAPPWGGTFHAIAHRLLRIYAEPMGLAPSFTVIDRTDAEDLMDLARENLVTPVPVANGPPGVPPTAVARAGRFPRKATCLAIYSRCVNADEPVERVLMRRFPWAVEHAARLRELFRLYEERKLARSVLDLDDLLVWWQGLVLDPRLGPDVAARFDHVLVDEYQDTNRLQRAILLALRRDNANLTVVGDDAQAIYGFRAATVRNILDFERDFPGAAVVRLETSYRSTAPILDATNAVIALARERHEKTLHPFTEGSAPRGPPGTAPFTDGSAPGRSPATAPRPVLVRCRDEAAEAEVVIADALARLEEGIPLRRQAVLFRAAHHSDVLEVELGRRRIPYRKFGGLRFLDAAHVKDLIAFLRIAENPADETAWFRVLRLLDGVGPKTARRVLDKLAEARFSLASLDAAWVPASARTSWSGLVGLVRDLAPVTGAAASVERVRVFYEPVLAERYDHAAARGGDLDALARVAQGATSRRDLLADLTLDPPQVTGDFAGPPVIDEDWLVLSTIHSAKGLEWDAVTLIRAVDGCIPSDLATGDVEEVEEERRLLYVALTRARRWLTVIAPLRMHVRDRGPIDRHVFAPLTRFLPAEVARHFDARTDEPAAQDEPAAPGLRAADAVRARVLGRWA